MRKKGQIFMMILVFVTLAGLVIIYVAMLSKGKGFDKDIGQRQFEILKAQAKAQRGLFYVDLSAKLAAGQAAYELGQQGGQAESACGDFIGYPLWYLKGKDCTPVKPNDAYFAAFDDVLNGYLLKYPDLYIPTSNYEYSVVSGKLSGIAKNPIVVPIIDTEEPSPYVAVQQPATVIGDYAWPSQYKIVTSCFGGRDVVDGSKDHKGIDIRARQGDPVFAIAAGTVTSLEPNIGGVRISHAGNLDSRYLHNSAILVNKGDTVQKGQVIARAGSVGTSVAHIHFETYVNKKITDPLETVFRITEFAVMFKQDANCVYNKNKYAYAALITPERIVS